MMRTAAISVFRPLVGRSCRTVKAETRRHGSSISVILLEPVENWGTAGEIVAVKRGFARNFLVPRAKACYATPQNKLRYATLLESPSKTSINPQVDNSQASITIEQAESLKGKRVMIKVNSEKVNSSNRLFASITASDIVLAIKEQFGGNILPISIIDAPSVKELGTHAVKAGTIEFEIQVTKI